MPPPSLPWLMPISPDFDADMRACRTPDGSSWETLSHHARTALGTIEILRLDRCLQRMSAANAEGPPIRLGLLGTATHDHLIPSLRVGALRHGLWLTIERGEFGQTALDRAGLTEVDTVLLAHDARTLLAELTAGMDEAEAATALDRVRDRIVGDWRTAKDRGCRVIQQTILPVFPSQFGSNEHRLPGSRAAAVETLNASLRRLADAEGVHLLSIDRRATRDGIEAWHDPVLWHRAKQEIHPGAAPMYGEMLARLLGACLGRSRKVLVLDLDNTLWGGVIGDDGLAGIALGQGTALGEAFLDVQSCARGLAQRGVVLAICSKNDEAVAWEPFDRHPDMLLRREDIACLVANWSDKASNLREIAARLNVGLDALVFVDDNPAERAIVRRELPSVAVPELPDDPAGYALRLSDAGYFEGIALTGEDRRRTGLYQANLQRAEHSGATTDMDAYLDSLAMTLRWSRIDAVGAPRVVQLINKTNQFNLTTRRTTDAAIAAFMTEPGTLSLQLRLTDRFGDNGLIAVVLGRREDDTVHITDWLMSCRVLQRRVEVATLHVIVAEARRMGARWLFGAYRPTGRNGMVAGHYAHLGFAACGSQPDGTTLWVLDVRSAPPLAAPLRYDPPLPAFSELATA